VLQALKMLNALGCSCAIYKSQKLTDNPMEVSWAEFYDPISHKEVGFCLCVWTCKNNFGRRMGYNLVKGEFSLFYNINRHVGSRPDGDSIWFKPNKLNERSIKQEEMDFTEPEAIVAEVWNRLRKNS
jgi:hypothetical protein